METFQSPEISVVIGTYNRKSFLKAAIESVRSNNITVPYEIIVVDGGSTDGSIQWLARQKDIISIIQHNHGTYRGNPIPRRSWGYFMNLGFKCAQGKYILMISDDALIHPDAIMKGYQHAENLISQGHKVGAVAFYWRNWPDQDKYWAGLTLGDKMFVNHGLYLREAAEVVGWIDEEHYQFYHADGDICLKMWGRDYEVIDCPEAFVEHFTHANSRARKSNLKRQQEDWEMYLKRWTGIYYDLAKRNTGGWIYLEHTDSQNVASRFPKTEVMVFRIKRNIMNLMRKLKKSS